VSLTEKLLLVFLGALVIPVLLQKGPFPQVAIIIGFAFSGVALGFWIVLVVRVYRKSGGFKDERR
jgi:hypothetical protein